MWGRPSGGGARAGLDAAALVLRGGLAGGPLEALASPPCRGIRHWLRRHTHREKLRKVNSREGGIFTTTSLHHTTLVHTCVRFTCPGRDAEGQEHGLRGRREAVRADRPRQRAQRRTLSWGAGPGRPEAGGRGPSCSIEPASFPHRNRCKSSFQSRDSGPRTQGRTEPGQGSSRWVTWAAGLRRGSGGRLSQAAGDTGPMAPRPSEGLQAGGRAESHVQGWSQNNGRFPEAGQ